MQVDVNGIIYSLSYALDCVEKEIVGVTADHGKWVAYISALIGKEYGYSSEELSDLSACAALHDNALTQYLAEEKVDIKLCESGDIKEKTQQDRYGSHCTIGEANVANFPFHKDTKGFILYHHENVDQSGPFGKDFSEIPVQAHIIHLADILDVACHINQISQENYSRMEAFLNKQRGVMFADEIVDIFFKVMPLEKYLMLKEQDISGLLNEEIPHGMEEYPFDKVQAMFDVFGKIVDYKSPFTRNHSEQIAEKIVKMAKSYSYDTEKCQRLYVAAVMHDIGKMAINNNVLEKPDKLTDTEFEAMQNHAWYTYQILKKINGFEDITEWASLHHEKLNGKGYPFGKTAEELSKEDRLMACIDIYQALSEDRPYKKGMPHEKCMAIMNKMVDSGLIDGEITGDIDKAFG